MGGDIYINNQNKKPFFFLSISVQVNTKSVAVANGLSLPVSLNPTTYGKTRLVVSPNILASASIPPTPQPSTPNPLIIVV